MFKKRAKREPDAFHQTFQEPLERLSGAVWMVIAVIAAVVVAVTVLAVFSYRESRRETAGWQRYTEALASPDRGKHALLLEKAAEDSPGTTARALDLLDAAGLLQAEAGALPPDMQLERERKLRRAGELLELFLADYPDHELRVPALERLALVQEDLAASTGDREGCRKALRSFEAAARAAEKSSFAFLAGKLLYGQARCELKLGNRDKAVELLTRALDKRPEDKGDAQEQRQPAEWYAAAEALLTRLRTARKSLLVAGAAQDQPAKPDPPAPGKKTAGP